MGIKVCLAWLMLVSAVLASCALHEVVQEEKIPIRTAAAFHSTCIDCHGIAEPGSGSAAFPPGADPSSYCLDCHKYRENHHPVFFAPATSFTEPFPLSNGQVTCLTCHDIHGPQGSKLLRMGPYADRRAICFKCHTNESDINPHVMKEKTGAIRTVKGKPVCVVCHVDSPDPSRDREENVRFNADIGFLCWRCHPPMPGSFMGKHFLVTPSYKTIDNMNRPEIRDRFSLPRAPWGRITCSTCHNPHQEGVISFGPASAGSDSPHKLRDPNLCAGCHTI